MLVEGSIRYFESDSEAAEDYYSTCRAMQVNCDMHVNAVLWNNGPRPFATSATVLMPSNWQGKPSGRLAAQGNRKLNGLTTFGAILSSATTNLQNKYCGVLVQICLLSFLTRRTNIVR